MAIGPQQARFICEYVKTFGKGKRGEQAALAAGYAKANARHQAAKLLAQANIRARIHDLIAAAAERALISASRTLREISFLAFSDIGEIVDFSGKKPRLKRAMDIPLRARRAIASMKVSRQLKGKGANAREVEIIEFKLWDKCAALDKLARHLALFVNQEELDALKARIEEIESRQKRQASRE